jgi:hypothetical protein
MSPRFGSPSPSRLDACPVSSRKNVIGIVRAPTPERHAKGIETCHNIPNPCKAKKKRKELLPNAESHRLSYS